MNKTGDYSKLLELLVKDFSWPTTYMFKFIVPFNPQSLNQLKALFADDADIKHRESKSSKYISFTAMQMMDNPDDIIAIYKQAEKIEKIIAI
jgi:hypothetical protein